MANIPYDPTQGEELYYGTKDFNPMDDAYDPASESPYLMEGRDLAQVRDMLQYVRGEDVIGNAKKIYGIAIDSASATPSNLDVFQYNSTSGEWESQPISLGSVESVQLAPQLTPPAYTEGLFYYDDNDKCFVAYNDEADVSQCIGRETFARVYNDSGSDIADGKLVYISGAFSGKPKVELAQANLRDTSRFLGMATHSIEDGTYGYITVRGVVNNLDTSLSAAGNVVYLDPDTPGDYTATRPIGENFVCEVGTILTSDASFGNIYVNPSVSELTAEMSRSKGFPANNEAEATLSFVDGTRTFSITPAGTEFHFYQEGIKYTKTSAEDLIISDVDGSHFIYYDDGVLTDEVNPTSSAIYTLILNKPLVAYVYWNATSGTATIVGEERHKAQTTDGFTPKNHVYTHIHEGARYTSGYTPSTVGTGGSGASNADAQFGIGAGSMDDEDIVNASDAIASTTGLRYYYRSGASGVWDYGTNAGYSFPVGATPLPQYNENTGATWQLTEVTSGSFMLLHTFGLNGIDTSINAGCVLGQNIYATIGDAQTAAESDIFNFERGIDFPFQEFIPIATFILECKTSFTNTPQARLVVNGDGDAYTDFRTANVTVSGGGGGGTTPPGGSNSYVQYNDSGAFGGSSAFTFDDLTDTLTITNMTCGGTSVFSDATITGGSIDGPTIGSTTEATIDHNALSNYVVNQHVDHSAVDINGTSGLSGGGAITTSRNLTLDITNLSAESTVDDASDYLVMYDNSAGSHKKVLVSNIVSTGGDVSGPTSSTDNAICRYDGATGKIIQNSVASLTDDGDLVFTGTADTVIRNNANNGFMNIDGGDGSGGDILLYGASHGTFPGDVQLRASTGGDVLSKASTNDGSTNAHRFLDSSENEVASIDSDGNATFAGDVTTNNLPAYNYIYNSDFNINQEAVTGTVVLLSGEYGHDGFKAGTSGCTYTFSTTAGVTTITISAGSLIHVVETTKPGDHTVAHDGTANVALDGGTSAASPVTETLTGGANVNVEFATGTIIKPRLNEGGVDTGWAKPDPSQMLTRAYRYAIEKATSAYASIGYGWATSTTNVSVQVSIPPQMRAKPTLSYSGSFRVTDGVSSIAVTALSVHTLFESPTDIIVSATVASGLTQYRIYSLEVNNDSTARALLSAKL